MEKLTVNCKCSVSFERCFCQEPNFNFLLLAAVQQQALLAAHPFGTSYSYVKGLRRRFSNDVGIRECMNVALKQNQDVDLQNI